MNETANLTVSIEYSISALRRELESLRTRMAADPDGELAQTAAMLRLKRGSRR